MLNNAHKLERVSRKKMEADHEDTRRKLGDLGEELAWLDENRPIIREDCKNGLRPCPFFGCRHHMGLDVDKKKGLRINFTDPTGRETCSLDIAEQSGPLQTDEIKELTGMTREEIINLEMKGMRKLGRSPLIRRMVRRQFEE